MPRVRLALIAVTVAVAVAGGGVAIAGTVHDDQAAQSHIDAAISELNAAKAEITAPPPTVTETSTVTAPPVTTTATATVTATSTVTVTAAATVEPKVASVYQNSGESWADACVRTMTYGYTGCVRYLPAGTAIAWDSTFQALATKVGDQRIDLQLTAKTYSAAGLKAVADNLPQKWRAGFIFNYYQEPEDNGLNATTYKGVYTDAAQVLRAAGLNLPYVEFQEWTLDPANTNAWGDISYLQSMMPPQTDVGGILWSLFEYAEKGNTRVADQVDRIKAASAQLAPGKPFALMASAYTLEGSTLTDAQKQAQAAWLTRSHDLMRDAGSVGWAWFNYNFPGTGGAAGESRVEVNSYALSALKAL